MASALLVKWAADQGALDLTALRGAITGLILIIIVLYVPGGFAGIMEGLKRLTWAQVFEGLRQSVTAAAPVERPAELAVPRARQPASGILLSLLNGLLGRNRGGRGN